MTRQQPNLATQPDTSAGFGELRALHLGVRLAESISGDSSFAHATAFCHAVERAANVEAPPRARALRTVCLELERIYNHIADIGAIATDVAFVVDENFQGRGVASFLFETLIRVARELGIEGFTADVLADNKAMLKVFEKAPFPIRAVMEFGIYNLTIPFEDAGESLSRATTGMK